MIPEWLRLFFFLDGYCVRGQVDGQGSVIVAPAMAWRCPASSVGPPRWNGILGWQQVSCERESPQAR